MLDSLSVRTLSDVSRLQAAALGDKVAQVFEGRETSYADFDKHANQVANGLIALGFKPGERIAYLGKNSDHYFELLFGAAKAGLVLTPLNWRLSPVEALYILNDARARALFYGPEFAEEIARLAPDAEHVGPVIGMEDGGDDGFVAWRDKQSDRDPQLPVEPSDVALQLYTSGTTGRPKGAMLTHRSLLGLRGDRSFVQPEWNTWTADDIALVAMPAFHIGGTGWGLTNLFNGAKGIIVREFDPGAVLDFIERDRITKIFMVPAAMQIVVRNPRARQIDWSCVRYMLYGASPIPLDLLKECMEVFGCGFVQMYGMTETSGTIVALPPEDHDPNGSPRMRSAGKAMPGVELAVLDEDGRKLPAGQLGEIATRSACNMAGYWNLEEATAKTIDAEGWLRTGDAGVIDEDGYVFIHDRVKDMIISGGENIYPAEVENAIYGHPGVAEVAVIGVPSERWGEAVKAMVVRKPGVDASPDDILAWARERIAAYKVPKSVDFIDALPRNPSGKILRRELREPYWAGVGRRVN